MVFLAGLCDLKEIYHTIKYGICVCLYIHIHIHIHIYTYICNLTCIYNLTCDCLLPTAYYPPPPYRYVIPLRERWLPAVTLDLSDEGRVMVVANHTVPLNAITECGAFSESYVLACVACYALGCFPWCLFALLLREAVLEYASMRVVSPLLGAVAILRAVLGPAFVIKSGMSLRFLFEVHWANRETIGVSFQVYVY
jgi:hypothetical protein